jgi:small subunit ribosomal protein S25e
MGGNKKKTTASNKTTASGPVAEAKKDTREDNIKKTEDRGKQKQRLSVFVEESQGRKVLEGMKAITVQGLARATGVKISVANSFVKSLESKGIVKNVGGYSGHRVYKLIK